MKGWHVNGPTILGGRGRRLAAACAAVALVAALGACSGDDDDDAAGDGDGDVTEQAEEAVDTALDEAQEALTDAQATIEEQEATIAELTTQVDTAEAAATDLQTQLDDETARADGAEASLAEVQAEIEEFQSNFPVTISASLVGYEDDLIGAYTLELDEAFCDALPTCGATRAPVRADIIQGVNGLELQVPNVFTTGLFMVEGSLFGVTDSNQILPACPDGSPVNAQVSTTIFADGVTIEADGTQSLTALGASVLVASDPAGECGPGNVFFSGDLTRV